jgi:molybdopterin-guanine dinucleotide biosynthesis protein A
LTIAGFVLVGGESRRMGSDKALLELEREPLLLRAARLLDRFVDTVTLLGSPARYSRFGLAVLADEFTVAGPLAGLATALKHSSHEWNLFLACDLPLVNEHVIQLLTERMATSYAQAIVPRTTDGWQPLCAAYHRSCLPLMEEALARRDLSIVKLFTTLRVEPVDADFRADPFHWDQLFRNINSAEEWEELRRLVGKR